MTSTLLDVTVCLLLVGVAVGTVGGPLPSPVADPATTDRADRVASVLATATTNVSVHATGETRRSHGTLAGLLARATVLSAVDSHAPFVDAVRDRVAAALPPRTQVVARWEPTRASPVRGELTVGDAPPAGASVHTATLSVPSGVPSPDVDASTGVHTTDDERAAALASHVVRGLFPPRETRLALRECGADATLVGRRYAGVATDLGVEVVVSRAEDGSTTAGGKDGQWCDRLDVDATDRALRGALTDAYAAEFGTAEGDVPTAPDRVRIVVRWWS